jgi:hypothetical protein
MSDHIDLAATRLGSWDNSVRKSKGEAIFIYTGIPTLDCPCGMSGIKRAKGLYILYDLRLLRGDTT